MSVFVVGVGFLYPCPFCSCEFSCEADLVSHLDVFGRCEHSLRLRLEHELLEDTQDSLHGGADRVIMEIARIVLNSRSGG